MADRTFRFASLASPDKTGYVLCTDHQALWDVNYGRDTLSYCSGQYDTYGDGLTAHSSTYGVGKDQFGDYCASLAAWLLEPAANEYQQKEKDEALKSLAWNWPSPSVERIRWLAALKPAEEKRWYNLSDRKISKSDSKRHDKRWNEVPEATREIWRDGDVKLSFWGNVTQRVDRMIWDALDQPRRKIFEHFAELMHIYETLREEYNLSWAADDPNHPCDIMGLDHKRVWNAFNALSELVTAWRARERAGVDLFNWRQSNEVKKAECA